MAFFGGGGAAPANMGGATSSAAGTAGLVPAPAAGDQNKRLKGNATFEFDFYSEVNFTDKSAGSPLSSFTTNNHKLKSLFPLGASFHNATVTLLNSIYWSPYYTPKDITITSIDFFVPTAVASSAVDLAIYSEHSTETRPDSVLATSYNTATTSNNTYTSVAFSNISVSAGIFYIAFKANNASFLPSFVGTTMSGGVTSLASAFLYRFGRGINQFGTGPFINYAANNTANFTSFSSHLGLRVETLLGNPRVPSFIVVYS
jgi:hypothetical protein